MKSLEVVAALCFLSLLSKGRGAMEVSKIFYVCFSDGLLVVIYESQSYMKQKCHKQLTC